MGRSRGMAFNKCLAIILCLVLCCYAEPKLFSRRSEKIRKEKPELVSGSDRSSQREEKEEQLHYATRAQKIREKTGLSRITRQSENPALQNLKSIAAGKGSILRVRSRTRGRGPTSQDLKPRTNSVLRTSLQIEENKSLEDTEEIEKILSTETNAEDSTSSKKDTRRNSLRKRKKKTGKRRKRPKSNNLRVGAQSKKQKELRAKNHNDQNVHLYNNEYVADLTGCHQVCDTLIYEVYKLLRGRHCDCF